MGATKSVPIAEMVDGPLVNAKGETKDANTLVKHKYKFILFAKGQAGLQFAQEVLKPWAEKLKSWNGKGRLGRPSHSEFIIVSSDTDKTAYDALLASGPWWAVPYDDAKRSQKLRDYFQNPMRKHPLDKPDLDLVLVEWKDRAWHVVNHLVEWDPYATYFPFQEEYFCGVCISLPPILRSEYE